MRIRILTAAAFGAAAALAGCMSAADNDSVGAQLAASDARLPGCAAAAGVSGGYRVWTEVIGHGPGTTVLREVRPGGGVSAEQAAQITACLNA